MVNAKFGLTRVCHDVRSSSLSPQNARSCRHAASALPKARAAAQRRGRRRHRRARRARALCSRLSGRRREGERGERMAWYSSGSILVSTCQDGPCTADAATTSSLIQPAAELFSKLHACANCKQAKVSCSKQFTQRPCTRCTRLQVPLRPITH